MNVETLQANAACVPQHLAWDEVPRAVTGEPVWRTRIEKDENGDAVLVLPPGLLAHLGWKIGDEIIWHVEDGKVWITRADECDEPVSP